MQYILILLFQADLITKEVMGLAKNLMADCDICPRECHADRISGKKGFCRSGADPVVARVSLHYHEEPCISGDIGSGTVFFGGCNMGCVYCQNQAISRGDGGKAITVERLAAIFLEQQKAGAANLNLVTPSHFTPQIIEGLELAKKQGLQIPVVWNSSAYEKVETLRLLSGLVDIYMPDFKYLSSGTAALYSQAADYPMAAKRALAEMFAQRPQAEFDEKGMLLRGCLVRHLLLPGQVEESKRVLQYLFREYGHSIYISIMGQYTPCGNLAGYPQINRRVTRAEYDELVDFALEIGIENAFVQDLAAADEMYIPEFDCRGV